MALLDPPRCPQCSSEIAMEEFWRVVPKQIRSASLNGSLGIVCPVCGVHLRVLQGRVQVSWLLAFAVPIAVVLLVGSVIPLDSGTVTAKATLIGLGVFYFAGFALQGHYSPRLLTLRFLRDGEMVEYPLVIRARELAQERAADEKLANE